MRSFLRLHDVNGPLALRDVRERRVRQGCTTSNSLPCHQCLLCFFMFPKFSIADVSLCFKSFVPDSSYPATGRVYI